ncbi:tail fiber protein [Photorhabdus luminescens]|uniref:tail fiber protein n=1 Tax=Photorhabdus luminescens TaxID=29488 RepID=UPI00223F111F|nr:tail fiber protein [Photorhabdus luminescens]MCW7762687.1 phage tail protein [Photorhabdus luminescens subsp. venezuelensis]
MEKKNDLSNSAINPENTDNKAETPSADDLKKRFKAGSIPLQIDYEHLIDIADIGRKAAGKAPQQNGPGAGLKLDDNGALNLKIGAIASKDYSPLILKDDILSVDLGSGLINKDNGICVGQGNGIVVNADNISVKAANGITVDGSGVSVKSGNGVSVSGNGVEVKAKNNGSISVDSEGIAVKCWDGGGIVVTDNAGLYLKLEGGNTNNAWSGVSGLSLSKSGVKVKAGNGIKVDDKGVSIDPNKVLPRGMIVMFSGSSVPEGWALCDGKNDTPNLIDRFILGGDFDGVKGQSNDKASGSANAKEFRINTTNKKLTITIKGTKLSLNQMPKHNHLGGMAYFSKAGAKYNTSDSSNEDERSLDNNPGTEDFMSVWNKGRNLFVEPTSSSYYFHTSDTGNGEEHTHSVDASANIIPPYYILAFIMKL